jgi:hypothetical protein
VCDQYVEPVTCAFNNSWWKWSGIKKVGNGQPPQQYVSATSLNWILGVKRTLSPVVAGSGPWRTMPTTAFAEDEAGSVEWLRLLIHTKYVQTTLSAVPTPRKPFEMYAPISRRYVAAAGGS